LGGFGRGYLIEVALLVYIYVCVCVLSTFMHKGLKARLTVEGKAGELLLGGLIA
jgi:hypothetical protein